MVINSEKRRQLLLEITELKEMLRDKEKELSEVNKDCCSDFTPATKLTSTEVVRYSRQIILPEIGMKGQLELRNSSVLIVGAGGLGCPAALYLAGAGVGHIGIIDYDEVEESNLHRQLLHTENDVRRSKVDSAADAIKRLNSTVTVTPITVQINSGNALNIIKDYNVVIDATDNVATRYLLNDACVLLKRPLVSGSALKFEGQLTVYNYENGPCYRCLFPEPPPPDTVSNCGDVGVLGAVPGVIGVLQSLETIKILLGLEGTLSSRLLLFDALDLTFRCIKLRNKNVNCKVCGDNPSITQLIDYEQFCGASANDKDSHINILDDCERLSANNLEIQINQSLPMVLIDVRSSAEFKMCSIPGSVNLPLKELNDIKSVEDFQRKLPSHIDLTKNILVCCICRRGNDSQRAVRRLKESIPCAAYTLKDLEGGLHSWSSSVDSSFPAY